MQDTQSLGCFVAIALALGLGLALLIADSRKKAARYQVWREHYEQSWHAYQRSLHDLKLDPHDATKRQSALTLGRAFSELTRGGRGVTLYDEVALMNDISAAAAGAGRPAAVASFAPNSPEERLAKLDDLRGRGIITDAEHRARREEILRSI